VPTLRDILYLITPIYLGTPVRWYSNSKPLTPNSQPMKSEELAKYIEQTDSMGKSWLLVQLRLQKLAEAKPDLSPEEYKLRLQDIYNDTIDIGEWWLGIENESF
jgi:hypothetical protein